MDKFFKWWTILTAICCSVTFLLEILAMCGVISVFNIWIDIMAIVLIMLWVTHKVVLSFYLTTLMYGG